MNITAEGGRAAQVAMLASGRQQGTLICRFWTGVRRRERFVACWRVSRGLDIAWVQSLKSVCLCVAMRVFCVLLFILFFKVLSVRPRGRKEGRVVVVVVVVVTVALCKGKGGE